MGGSESDTEESEVLIGESDEEGDIATFADEGETAVTTPAADAKVSLTVSDKGVLASASDSEHSAMVRKEVTVKDLNSDGILTYDEALVAAHEAYNSADGYVTEPFSNGEVSGVSVTKLWGVSADSSFFYLNGNALESNVADTEKSTVKEGDALYAAILQDNTTWSDLYASFDTDTKEVSAGEDVTLTLTAGGSVAAGVPVGTWTDGSFTALEGKITDENGQVTLSFADAGTYLVTANGTVKGMVTTDWSTGAKEEKDCPIMAPACVVTVSDTTGPKVIAEGTCGATDADDVTWKLTEDGVLTVSGTGSIKNKPQWADEVKNQTLELKIEGGVSVIGDEAFREFSALKTVKLESGVEKIGQKAFMKCSCLETAELSETLTTIGTSAFNSCKALQSVRIPESVENMGQNLFRNCTQLNTAEIYGTQIPNYAFDSCANLQTVIIGDKVTSIGQNAFAACGMKELTIPENISSVNEYVFGTVNNNSLETLHINCKSVLSGKIFNKCKALKTVTIGKNVPEIKKEIFSGATALESLTVDPENTSVNIQDDVLYSADGKTLIYCVPQKSGQVTVKEGTEAVGESAFKGCTKITGIILPESMSTLGENSFADCTGLTRLELPESIENLNAGMFRSCTSLQEIAIKNSKYVNEGALVYTADKKTLVLCAPGYAGTVAVADKVESIADEALYNCSGITEITLPSTLTTIGSKSFAFCSGLKKIELPDSVTSAGFQAFSYCKALETITLSAGLKSLSNMFLESCSSLEKVMIPEGVTDIGSSAFWNCTGLQEIILPDSLQYFSGSDHFSGCKSLVSISIPDNVEALSDKMFQGCTGLQSVVLPEKITGVGTAMTWNGTPLDVSINYKGSPKQWQNIPNSTGIGRDNITFYYGVPTDNSMINVQPEDANWREGTLEADMEPLSIRTVKVQNGESYEYTWFCNTEESLKGASILNGETISSDGRWSQYIPDTSKAGNYYYYCMVAKKDAAGAVQASAISQGAEVKILFQDFNGSGSENDPYQITSQDDLTILYNIVNSGRNMKNIYFQMTKDISLDETWKSIGTITGSSAGNGKNIKPFSGIFDGAGHTLTIARGGVSLFGYVREATVKNLNIQGEYIVTDGLLANYVTDYGPSGSYSATATPRTIDIDNVTIKSGTVIKKNGLIGGNGSGINYVNISNCTVERNVKIGWDADANASAENIKIGSLASRLNGNVVNCISYADVYGSDIVGGLVAEKGQSMGPCGIINSQFHGTVHASGNWAGGIIARGYTSNSAPNTPGVTIQYCYVSGTIIGQDYVGGIYGAESGQVQAWNENSISNNKFMGNIEATGSYVGGVVGYIHSLNRCNIVENNSYLSTCGAAKGIGGIRYIDTSAKPHGWTEDKSVYYMNTSVDDLSQIKQEMDPDNQYTSVSKTDLNRTDDPLGADAEKLTKATDTVSEPDGKIAYKLEVKGTYKTEYYIGEDLDLTGMELTVTWTDGSTSHPSADELTVSGFNNKKRGVYEVTLTYGAAKAVISVRVLKRTDNKIGVSFTLLGDENHDVAKDGKVHTLKENNLTTWIPKTTYEVDMNATVKDVLELALTENGMTWVNETGNYVSSITNGKITLGEFSNNTKLSGWMYTLNDSYPDLGVSEQFLEDGDVIIFHFTDDYTVEHHHKWHSEWSYDEKGHWHDCDDWCPITDNKQKDGYAGHTAGAWIIDNAATGAKHKECTVCGYIMEKTEPVQETGHKYGVWTTTTAATVFTQAVQTRTCSICGKKETRKVGSKLKPTMTVNLSTVPLKVKQKTSVLRVTGLANGDKVQSYKSGNTKIFKVSKSGVITAGKKTGKATLTITLASGLKKNLTVKVQKKAVATTKITGLQSKITLKKGQKLTLKPGRQPLTSTQKFTYKSSGKKIATVNSKGVITARKAGKTKITVKSGKKKFTVTVTVTK